MLKPVLVEKKSSWQEAGIWTRSRYDSYRATSIYSHFIRGPDSLKGENSEVRVKCCKCGMEKLEKNPEYSRNNQAVPIDYSDVFLVKNSACSQCKRKGYIFEPVDKNIRILNKVKFRQHYRARADLVSFV